MEPCRLRAMPRYVRQPADSSRPLLLNILSVAVAGGVVTLVWQHGYGSEALWGIPAAGSIPSWLPLMLFAFLVLPLATPVAARAARARPPDPLARRPPPL